MDPEGGRAPGAQRVAAIDVGSNSVRLMVADRFDSRLIPVYTQRIVSRLLEGLCEGALDERCLDRTLDAIEILSRKARALGARQVLGFGTSAMRDGCKDSARLIERAEALGVRLRVLSGEEEARLAYAGVAPPGRAGVIDIGGGSTEFITGQDGRALFAASAQMGAVRLKERSGGETRPQALLAAARSALAPSARAVMRCPRPDGWVGVGGTFTALAAMEMGLPRYDGARVEGFSLTAEAAAAWLERLAGMGLQARLAIPGLIAERADIIVFGAAIAAACFDLIGCPRVTVSDSDNLIGFLRGSPARP